MVILQQPRYWLCKRGILHGEIVDVEVQTEISAIFVVLMVKYGHRDKFLVFCFQWKRGARKAGNKRGREYGVMFSFPGLLSVVFFSGVAVIILKLVFRNNNAILYMDIRFLFICMLLILIRMFVPIESPIANNIPIYKIYPDIYIFIKESYFKQKS